MEISGVRRSSSLVPSAWPRSVTISGSARPRQDPTPATSIFATEPPGLRRLLIRPAGRGCIHYRLWYTSLDTKTARVGRAGYMRDFGLLEAMYRVPAPRSGPARDLPPAP